MNQLGRMNCLCVSWSKKIKLSWVLQRNSSLFLTLFLYRSWDCEKKNLLFHVYKSFPSFSVFHSQTQNSLVCHLREWNCLLMDQMMILLQWSQICFTQWYQNLVYSLLFDSHLLPGQKENYFKMLKCMKFAPLSSLGAVISNKPFGFFFWSIFNCLVGKAKLLLESLIFLSSAVTWISPFSSPPPPLPTALPLLRASWHSPRCQVRNNHSGSAACSILLLFKAFKGRTPFPCARHLGRVLRRWRRRRSSCCCPRTAEELRLAGSSRLAFI